MLGKKAYAFHLFAVKDENAHPVLKKQKTLMLLQSDLHERILFWQISTMFAANMN